MPSPREIATSVNDPAGFRPDADEGQPSASPDPKGVDYSANPKNPPADAGTAPFKNLKGG